MKQDKSYSEQLKAFENYLKNVSEAEMVQKIQDLRNQGFGGGPTIQEYFKKFQNSFSNH